ncbi:hypothetical protein [Pseudoxanthomonas sp.]|uniref:hypothetical protein n=1 Tax=Pseudoxanthomonas sp. TaxID=1871049 RepID=UPI00261A40C6|nr:hypothetical protein [Pseudoxanthomonas sp.]WDS36842.1 MAG: hypothetical protein O8I58_02735 [Pseudoxanthomonas sp.]
MSLAAQRLIGDLEGICAALHAQDYPSLERRVHNYDEAVRDCFSQAPSSLSHDECQQLLRAQAELLSLMGQMRDEASEWLHNAHKARQAIRSYATLR